AAAHLDRWRFPETAAAGGPGIVPHRAGDGGTDWQGLLSGGALGHGVAAAAPPLRSTAARRGAAHPLSHAAPGATAPRPVAVARLVAERLAPVAVWRHLPGGLAAAPSGVACGRRPPPTVL